MTISFVLFDNQKFEVSYFSIAVKLGWKKTDLIQKGCYLVLQLRKPLSLPSPPLRSSYSLRLKIAKEPKEQTAYRLPPSSRYLLHFHQSSFCFIKKARRFFFT